MQTIATVQALRQIPSLTALRFIAALCIVLSHALPKIAPSPHPPTWMVLLSQASAEGMTLFFVLSGFVIYYNYSEAIREPWGLRNFFAARFARLYPLYFVCLSYDLLMQFSWYGQVSTANLAALPYYVTLTQTWIYKPIADHALVYQFGHIASVAWSISTEWFFYLAFPFLCAVISPLTRIRYRLFAAALLVVAALSILVTAVFAGRTITEYAVANFGPVAATQQDGFYRWLLYFSPYARLFEFMLGCLCASVVMKLRAAPSALEQRFGFWLIIIAVAGTLALHWLMFGATSDAQWRRILLALHMNFGFSPLIALLIFCCARYQNAIVRLLSSRPLVLCGEASYSLYLLHMIVINAFRYEAPPVTSARVAIGALLQLIIVVFASIGLSLVTWSLIEVPARARLRKLLSRRPIGSSAAPIGPSARLAPVKPATGVKSVPGS